MVSHNPLEHGPSLTRANPLDNCTATWAYQSMQRFLTDYCADLPADEQLAMVRAYLERMNDPHYTERTLRQIEEAA